MTEEITIPAGYWMNADGALIPVAKIKPVDKDRTKVVTDLCEQAKRESERLLGFKLSAMQAVQDFIKRSLADYDATVGGKKGNVTLVTFDGRYKITRQMQDSLVFDERLQAAKVLIDECIQSWSRGSHANLKVLVNRAFQVDKQGQISTGRVLDLRTYEIEDEKWQEAMRAISDSIRVASTKPYVRFYERDAAGVYQPIVLDVAAV